MNKNTYHFTGLRLHNSPQTRIKSEDNTTGFSSFKDCDDFCKAIGFSYTIWYFDINGNKIKQ